MRLQSGQAHPGIVARSTAWASRTAAPNQVVTSFATFLALILASRSLSPRDFGLVAAFQMVLLLALGIQRAYLLLPVLIDATLNPALPIRQVRSGVLLFGAVLAMLGVLTALATKNGVVRDIGFLLAITAWPSLYWDAVRSHYQGRHAHRELLTGDIVNLVVTGAWFGGAAVLHMPAQVMCIGLAVGPLLSALILLPPWSRRWIPTRKPQKMRRASALLGDYAFAAGLQQALILFAGIFFSLEGIGAIRLAQTAMGPAVAACLALETTLTPQLRDSWSGTRTTLVRAVVPFGILALATSVVGIALAAIPARFGEMLLGPTWATASEIIGAGALKQALVALTLVPVIALRVSLRVTRLAATRFLTAMITIGVALAVLPGRDIVSFMWTLTELQLVTTLNFWMVASWPTEQQK